MQNQERIKEYRKKYLEKNRVRIYKKQLSDYLPKSMQSIAESVPEKVQKLYQDYPFETFGEPVIKRAIKKNGISEHRIEYQECYAAATDAYMYSIHRCAFCGYLNVGAYIKKMVAIAIIWGIIIANENKYLCKVNNLKNINIDAYERKDI